jgi:hypothetical protein
MKRLWAIAILAAVTLLLGQFSYGRTPLQVFQAASASSSRLPHVYWKGCPAEHAAELKPTEMPVSCADYGVYIAKIKWSEWTSKAALGRGTLYTNSCTPNCASGTFSTSRTEVKLTDPTPTRTQGLVFSRLAFTEANGRWESIPIGPPKNCGHPFPSPGYC